jgi:hypothetical protein
MAREAWIQALMFGAFMAALTAYGTDAPRWAVLLVGVVCINAGLTLHALFEIQKLRNRSNQ